jgi:signal transduction histidine kinase
MELRMLVLAPRGRDAEVVRSVLAPLVHRIDLCADDDELLRGLEEGAAAAVVTEEALQVPMNAALYTWLEEQPTWSDFPFIVLASRQPNRRPAAALAMLHALGNVILLERPLNAETLTSAANASIRARRRQYATRQHLGELREARATVQRLNLELEERIALRTSELAGANDRLMAEISERERAQAALVQVQKMEAIGRLTGGIAHDFNNLLHVVNMNLDLVARMKPEPKVAAIAAQAKRAVARGSKLTGQLLSFARTQSLLPRVTDLNALITDMRELVAISVGAQVQVEIDLAVEPVVARLDANQLEMAILNLAVNAKDAMPGGGTLTIRTQVKAGHGKDESEASRERVVVTVQDTGEGIPAHLLTKVFDPFFTTKGIGKGTGLGLSQVYGFARQSGGNATIDSEPGFGTQIEMAFPAARACDEIPQGRDSASDSSDLSGAPDARRHRILVVEDDPDVRRVISESLRLGGHEVTEAEDGVGGLGALERETPDLLIVDYAMPGMTGAEVIARARAEVHDLPVIMATGYADMAEVGRVIGTQSILIKPFDIATLHDAVARALPPVAE